MNNNLKDLYDKVFEKIKPKIKDLKKGILYKSIQIILLEDNPNVEQVETLVICNRFDIRPNAYRNEDIIFVHNIREIFSYTISESDIEREVLKKIKTATEKILNYESGDKKMEELKWIVFGACAVLGAYFCIQYLEGQNKKNSISKMEQVNRKSEDLQYTAPRSPISAALCLIVPANTVISLSNGVSINVNDLSYLIDSASYFVCATTDDANLIEQQLTMTSETISPNSNREVYIRIKISDCENLIDKKITYILKTNLPVNVDFIVEKIACLRSLSGLESFNRI
jgi:hypothetical protein